MPLILPTKTPAAGGFDVVNDITWHALWWPEGANFVAEGYSDGGEIGDWPDEINGWNALQTTAARKPLYDDVDPDLNSQPSVQFAGDEYLDALTSASDWSSPTSPCTYVFIGTDDHSTGDYRQLMDGTTSSQEHVMSVGWSGGNAYWLIDSGGVARNGNQNHSGGFLAEGRFYSAASTNEVLRVDGTQAVNADAGTEWPSSGIRIGNRWSWAGSVGWLGAIALVGVYEGTFWDDSAYSDFTTWAEDHYGLTIA